MRNDLLKLGNLQYLEALFSLQLLQSDVAAMNEWSITRLVQGLLLLPGVAEAWK